MNPDLDVDPADVSSPFFPIPGWAILKYHSRFFGLLFGVLLLKYLLNKLLLSQGYLKRLSGIGIQLSEIIYLKRKLFLRLIVQLDEAYFGGWKGRALLMAKQKGTRKLAYQ